LLIRVDVSKRYAPIYAIVSAFGKRYAPIYAIVSAVGKRYAPIYEIVSAISEWLACIYTIVYGSPVASAVAATVMFRLSAALTTSIPAYLAAAGTGVTAFRTGDAVTIGRSATGEYKRTDSSYHEHTPSACVKYTWLGNLTHTTIDYGTRQ
jgi:hypothetical protein